MERQAYNGPMRRKWLILIYPAAAATCLTAALAAYERPDRTLENAVRLHTNLRTVELLAGVAVAPEQIREIHALLRQEWLDVRSIDLEGVRKARERETNRRVGRILNAEQKAAIRAKHPPDFHDPFAEDPPPPHR